MKVLFVNQTGQVSGAERSLLTLLDALPRRIEAEAAVPTGELVDALRVRGIPVHAIRGTSASFRPHPLHTSRALAEVGASALALRRLTRRGEFALIHANTTRAGLIAASASRLGGPPVVTHVRDWIPPGRVPAAIVRWAIGGSAAVIANSSFVARQLPPGRRPVHVVHNPVDLERFDPGRTTRAAVRSSLGLAPEDEVLGVVGQLTPWKGQEEAVRAAALLAPHRPRLRLLIVGSAKFASASTRFDNRAYAERLHRLPHELGIEHVVRFTGERDDVPQILSALDLLLVPSWQEAFGRVAAEGMAMGVPVLATACGGTAEIVRDGIDGRVLAPLDPALWARAAGDLLGDAERLRAMGASGRERAIATLGAKRHAESVAAVYDSVLSAS